MPDPNATVSAAAAGAATGAAAAAAGMPAYFLPYFNTFFAGAVAVYLLTYELPKMRDDQNKTVSAVGIAINQVTLAVERQSQTNVNLAAEIREARLTRERSNGHQPD